MPRFAETFCSQCGNNLGPGDSGVSHCDQHEPKSKVHGDVCEALYQALEYFEDREDVVDGSYGEPAPNLEMSLAQLCRAALRRVELNQSL